MILTLKGQLLLKGFTTSNSDFFLKFFAKRNDFDETCMELRKNRKMGYSPKGSQGCSVSAGAERTEENDTESEMNEMA